MKSQVLTLNLRNRMIFRSADEADAVQAADFTGKKRVVKRSWGYSTGKRNVNYNETEEHKNSNRTSSTISATTNAFLSTASGDFGV